MMESNFDDEDIVHRRSKLDELQDYVNDSILNPQYIHDWMNEPRLRSSRQRISKTIFYCIWFTVFCLLLVIFFGNVTGGSSAGATTAVGVAKNSPGSSSIAGQDGKNNNDPFVHGGKNNNDGSANDDDTIIIVDGVEEIYDNDPKNPDLLQPIPTNVNIVFIGDSISRYQYLSLVYFLRYGRWFEPDLEKNNLVNEKSFISPFHNDHYGEFYFQSSRLLQPYELCDCYKYQKYMDSDITNNNNRTGANDIGKYIIENRYYHDPTLNNTITFIHAYGHSNVIHGRIPAEDVYDIDQWDWHKKEKRLIEHKHTKPIWEYEDWSHVIKNYISNINPQPEHLILNAGQWKNSFGPATNSSMETTTALLNSLQNDLNPEQTTAYWKTTSYKRNGIIMNNDNNVVTTDLYMCEVLGNCLDISWTSNVHPDLYWDDVHFYEPVYRIMNEQMLLELDYLPENYVTLNRERIFSKNNNNSGNDGGVGETEFEPNPDEYDNNGNVGNDGSDSTNKNDIEDDIDDVGEANNDGDGGGR